MHVVRAGLAVLGLGAAAAFANACFDSAQSPPAHREPPAEGFDGSMLGPIDLVYVCGNKFILTNSTKSAAQIEYRVAGTDETGSLTLREGPTEDPGFSETELVTRERGIVELYQDGERVARGANAGTACGAPAISASVVGAASPTAGSWSGPFPLPIVALHISLLPTGKVLMWGHLGTPQVWDPATGSRDTVPSPAWVFCAGHSFLADGRLLVSGGHISANHGIPDNTIFHANTQSWSKSNPMLRGRWYPTNTTMGNGDVVITAGRDENGVEVEEPEVWSAATGAVRVLTGAKRMLPYYPRAFLAPNGRLFYAGEQVTTRYLDISGSGSWSTVGNHVYTLPRDYGSAVMYEPGKILYSGGGRVTETAEIIDLRSAATWQWTGSMAFKRRHHVATMLPTGEVLVTGGSSGPEFNNFNAGVHAAEVWNPATGVWSTLASNTVTRTYHAASLLLPDGRILHSGSGAANSAPDEENYEIFSPPYLFKGARPTISDAPSNIAYGSSFGVTTPDAAGIAKISLIRLGSMTHAFDMNQRFEWLSFTAGSGTLTVTAPTDRNLTPPGHYMLFILNGEGVPSVAKIVRVGGSGDPPPSPPPPTINLTTSGRQDATKQYMTLVWSGANGANVDVYRNGSRITTTPNDGRYVNSRAFTGSATYVYKVCQAGTTTCSNESTVVFGGNSPPSAGFTASCTGLTCTLQDGSSDSDGTVTGWAWDFGDETSASERNPSHTYAAAGTYTITLTATDNDGARGSTSKQMTVTAGGPPPSGISLTVSGRQDATKQYMTLDWTGATGANVDVYRNGVRITTTPNDGRYVNSRAFTGAATYTYKVCQAGSSVCSNEATVEFGGGAPPGNAAPAANFASSCSGLGCAFTDQSTDSDGMVTGWTWAFGDGGSSTAQNPNHTYAAAGTYSVMLTARDNAGASGSVTRSVTVSAPGSGITLTASGRSDGTKQYMTLDWTGATGANMDVFRNGVRITTTPNDGRYVNSRIFQGTATYRYRVCQAGTTTCSNEATVSFP